MKKKSPKSRIKPYFCHDENLEFLQLRKHCNQLALFKSVIKIMGRQGARDPEIIEKCNKDDYHIITHNTSDFMGVSSKIKIGIVCIGTRSEEDWISKFSKLVKNMSKHKNFYYKDILISNITTIRDRSTGETKVIS